MTSEDVDNIKISVSFHPDEKDKESLSNNLHLSNVKHGMPESTRCWVLMKNSQDKLIGGCFFYFFEEFVYIDKLWIDENYQRKGYGKKILVLAEDEAKKNGCKTSHLDTFDFQKANGFYEKCGYVETSQHALIDKKHIQYFMMKKLL